MRVQSRRTDVFPTTWEIPTGLGLVWLLGSVLALPAGQGLAYAVTGEGFAWPGSRLGESLQGLLTGELGTGLPPGLRASTPPMILVVLVIVILELALAATAIWTLARWWRSVGPLAQVGLATKQEVAQVLGARSLRRRAKTIRPDLTGGGRS